MATDIILKHSSTENKVPDAGSLKPGELAINIKDEKAYIKNADGTVVQIAGTGSGNQDLGYTAAPGQGTVTITDGTDAVIPLADGTNAGLITADEKRKLDGLSTDTENDAKYVEVTGDNMTGNLTFGPDDNTDREVTISSTGSIKAYGLGEFGGGVKVSDGDDTSINLYNNGQSLFKDTMQVRSNLNLHNPGNFGNSTLNLTGSRNSGDVPVSEISFKNHNGLSANDRQDPDNAVDFAKIIGFSTTNNVTTSGAGRLIIQTRPGGVQEDGVTLKDLETRLSIDSNGRTSVQSDTTTTLRARGGSYITEPQGGDANIRSILNFDEDETDEVRGYNSYFGAANTGEGMPVVNGMTHYFANMVNNGQSLLNLTFYTTGINSGLFKNPDGATPGYAYGYYSGLNNQNDTFDDGSSAFYKYNFYAGGYAPNFLQGSTYIGGTAARNTFDLWKSTLTEEQLEQLEAGTFAVPANVSTPGDGSYARQWYYNQQSAEDQALLDSGELEYPTPFAAATFTDTFSLDRTTNAFITNNGSGFFKENVGVGIRPEDMNAKLQVRSNNQKILRGMNTASLSTSNLELVAARPNTGIFGQLLFYTHQGLDGTGKEKDDGAVLSSSIQAISATSDIASNQGAAGVLTFNTAPQERVDDGEGGTIPAPPLERLRISHTGNVIVKTPNGDPGLIFYGDTNGEAKIAADKATLELCSNVKAGNTAGDEVVSVEFSAYTNSNVADKLNIGLKRIVDGTANNQAALFLGTNSGRTYYNWGSSGETRFYGIDGATETLAYTVKKDGSMKIENMTTFNLQMESDDPAAFQTTYSTDEEGNQVEHQTYVGTTEDLLSIIKDLRARVAALEAGGGASAAKMTTKKK